jgi:hypothetical protein
MLYTDLFKMIEDVRRAVAAGDRVVNMDNPVSLHLGYQGLTQEWAISLFNVKKMRSRKSDWTQEQAEAYEQFRTIKGRLELVYRKS